MSCIMILYSRRTSANVTSPLPLELELGWRTSREKERRLFLVPRALLFLPLDGPSVRLVGARVRGRTLPEGTPVADISHVTRLTRGRTRLRQGGTARRSPCE